MILTRNQKREARSHKSRRLFFSLLVSGFSLLGCGFSLLFPAFALLAQEPRLSTTARLVVAPATVLDRNGRYIDGLMQRDFVLYDNGERRAIDVDVSFTPISLVIAVQTSDLAREAVNRVHRIGSMIEPLVIGERGEAAVIQFDTEITTVQGFTSDPDRITRALRALTSGGDGSRMIDAAIESVKMLGTRPPRRRRVLILISEAQDRSSKARLEDAVTLAQEQNVMVYPLTYSAFLSGFTGKAGQPPPGAGVLNLIAIFTEIRQLAKTNAGDALARYTGGSHLSFLKQRSLERAISRIGEELHAQYFLAFQAPGADDGRFHAIDVRVPARSDLIVRARPGYWLGAP